MKVFTSEVGLRWALCVVLFVATAHSSVAQSAKGRNRSSIKGQSKGELRERFAKANAANRRNRASSHRVTARVSSGNDSWEVTATPSGLTAPIATEKRAPVRIALRFPLAKPGEKAVVTLLNEGGIKLLGPRPQARNNKPRKPQPPSKVLTARVGPDRTVRLVYQFGQALHNQKIEAKVGLARAVLNLHLHDGSDGH